MLMSVNGCVPSMLPILIVPGRSICKASAALLKGSVSVSMLQLIHGLAFIVSHIIISFKEAVKDANEKNIDVLITSPIDKNLSYSKSFKHSGHTDFLRHYFNEDPIMLMVSKKLKVGFLTEHIALKDVVHIITVEKTTKTTREKSTTTKKRPKATKKRSTTPRKTRAKKETV